MIQGRVGVWDPSKLDDVIYEQPRRYLVLHFFYFLIHVSVPAFMINHTSWILVRYLYLVNLVSVTL